MATPKNNYDLLITKLDRFIRKFYINKLIRGTLLCLGLVLIAFLTISLAEHFAWFGPNVRRSMFYGFIGLAALSACFWVLMPLLQFFKLGRVINHQQAASIIGDHFTDVRDKLLNVLQLKEQSISVADASLIEASIDQKVDDIKPVPFTGAIDLSNNRQYLKYALLPLLVLVGILFIDADMITQSSQRIIKYDEAFEPDAPFHFKIQNEADMEVVQYEDLDIDVITEGEVMPAEAFIHLNGSPNGLKLRTTAPGEFAYTFNKLQKTTSFYLQADGFRSRDYEVTVIPKPTMLSFDASVNYPNYTGRKDEVMRNSGDMIIPTGTKVTWRFEAENTDKVQLKFKGKTDLVEAKRNGEREFSFSSSFYKDTPYTIYLSNERIENADSISYAISVIPDAYPTISVEQKADSADVRYLYFFGDAADDYGIKSLSFLYKIEPEKGDPNATFESLPMDITAGRQATSYTHTWNVEQLGLKAGDRLTYYFMVWDNDAINGSKSAQTQMMTYATPSIEELDQQAEENNEQLKEDLMDLVEDSEELKDELKELKEELTQKKELDWQDKEKMEELIKEHKEMQQKIEQVQQNFKENQEQQNDYKEFSEDILEKQEKLEEMMNELMTDEMKEMMEKLEEMLEEMTKEELMEELEDFEMTDEQLEQEMDRMLELFKQLEFEQKLEETVDKLEELAEEQEELSEETEEDQDGNLEEQMEKQEEIEEEFEKLKEEIEELEEMNEELGGSQDLEEETKEESQEASDQMQESQENMQQQQQQKASENQKNAAEQMQQMAQELQQMQMQQQQEQAQEDMEAIRQLLENLITLSIDEEDLMEELGGVSVNTPQYTALAQQQHKLKDDGELIEDSLVALSKRNFQLEAFITAELAEINRNMGDAIENLEDRKKKDANVNQQFIMTGLNNLALMLDEAMQQMQQQMSGGMPGSQMCNKPGSAPSMKPGQMGKMQQQLNESLKKMAQEMKGGKGGKGKMSKEAAQMAAQQQALRQALQEMNEEFNKDGKGKGKDGSLGDLEKLAEEMEKAEEDIVNKRITQEMLNRQNEILDKLLKAEDALKKRELDDQREAQTAEQYSRETPPEMEEYLKKRQAEVEMYQTVPPSLKPYYKSLVERYFQSISF